MAEAALLGIANSVLGKLSDPALKEFLLLWNVDKDLKKLRQTIETISDVLHDAEQKESRERAVKGWISRLRTVLYDADDLFDAVAYMALRKKAMPGNAFKKEVRQFFSKSNQLAFNFKMAHDIKDIREALDDIEKDMKPFGFKLLNVEEKPLGVRTREETHCFVDADKVIGRDQDKEKIIDLLLARDQKGEGNLQRNFSVVSVIGFGGLGKTTLAQLVYGDERVKRSFDLCLWVCINYFSDLKSVLMAILESSEGSSLNNLQGRLREKIGGQKFLLVLDDVWDEDVSNWGELEKLLDCGKRGSMVLATTRKLSVARCLDPITPYYELSVLSEESAWSLFVKMTFKDGELSSESDLVPLVQQIVRKCGYVPLALVTIGRMLRSKEKDNRIWLSFVEKELPEVLSGGFDKNKLLHVLMVSYNDLPSAIKHCFAYCSLFPKDCEFDKDELVRLWLAQGFVEKHPIKSLEEVGDSYFFFMVDRCFFQEVKTFVEDGIFIFPLEVKPHERDLHAHLAYRCKMHDLLHDLAIQVAGTESKCFDGEYLSEEIESNVFRHISINRNPNFSFDDSCLSILPKTIRTFKLHYVFQLKTDSLNSIVVTFKMLRVLSLARMNFEKLPNTFEELVHLRYLDISNNGNLKVLPNSICKLLHLQTLDLRGCRSLLELPSKLGRLVSLRHLFVYGCSKLDYLFSELASLTSLVTLDWAIVHSFNGNLKYLGDLHNLSGMLRVELSEKRWENCIGDARKSNLSKKEKLYGMFLRSGKEPIEFDKEEIKAVLEALQPHVNLQYLKIVGFGSDTLSSWFSSLSNLKELSLEGIKTLEYLDPNGVTSGSIFKSLRILKLKSLPELKGWWREAATPEDDDTTNAKLLPWLSNVFDVVIERCPNLMESMPSFRGIGKLKFQSVDGKFVCEFLKASTLNKIEEITFIYIKGSWCLPEGSIKHWTTLRSLNILISRDLEWVSDRGLACLTSLEKLLIQGCNDVILNDEDDAKVGENNRLGIPWKDLSRLRKLEVPWQRYLQGGLQYLTSLEELTMSSHQRIPLKEEAEEKSDNKGLGMPWKHLQRLRYLDLSWQSDLQGGIQYLTSLEVLILKYDRNEQVEADNQDMEVRGKTWEGLARLQTLTIEFSTKKTFSFPKWIQYLLCVRDMEFKSCGELRMMSWEVLASMKLLSSLTFDDVVNVDETVADQLNQFNSLSKLSINSDPFSGKCENWIHDIPWKLFCSLRTLTLYDLQKLRCLPDGIQHLTSLKQLIASRCYGIKRIPEWMTKLTTLQSLKIGINEELKERCKREIGADWHLVSHIPKIW